jgi:carboxyl-terminal processing protease
VRRNPLLMILAVLAPIALLAIGIYLGGHPSGLPDPIRQALVGDEHGQLFDEALGKIHDDYYRKIGETELTDQSITGMVASLKDKYSHYFTPKEFSAYMDQTNAQFTGVGIEVTVTKTGLKVARVYAGSPAAKAGMKAGDVIVTADGHALAGLTVDKASNYIRGKDGTKVPLAWERGTQKISRDVERAVVSVPVVASKMRTAKDGTKIAQVALSTFSRGSSKQLRAEVDKRIKQGAKGILLDLRHNGGGLVDEARLVGSIFIPKGKIVTIKGRNEPTKTLMATGDAISSKIPVAVLVDDGTASAAEIVSGAIQDDKRGVLIGGHTYGKGVFQEVQQLTNGGALDLTVGQYFLPSGRNLGGTGVAQGGGLQPDVKVADDTKTPKSDEVVDAGVAELAAKVAS